MDDLAPVVWNDAAFSHLELPGTEKQLAWDFVESKTLANSFDDFIQDKGKKPQSADLSTSDIRRAWYHHSHVWSTWCRKDLYRRSRYGSLTAIELFTG